MSLSRVSIMRQAPCQEKWMLSVRFAAAGTVSATGSLAVATSPWTRSAPPTLGAGGLKCVAVARSPAKTWVPSDAPDAYGAYSPDAVIFPRGRPDLNTAWGVVAVGAR